MSSSVCHAPLPARMEAFTTRLCLRAVDQYERLLQTHFNKVSIYNISSVSELRPSRGRRRREFGPGLWVSMECEIYMRSRARARSCLYILWMNCKSRRNSISLNKNICAGKYFAASMYMCVYVNYGRVCIHRKLTRIRTCHPTPIRIVRLPGFQRKIIDLLYPPHLPLLRVHDFISLDANKHISCTVL